MDGKLLITQKIGLSHSQMLVNWYYINLFLVFVGTGSQATALPSLKRRPIVIDNMTGRLYSPARDSIKHVISKLYRFLDRDLSSCSVYRGA
jgi:hypothetical protein